MIYNAKGSVGFVGAKINWKGLNLAKIIEGVDLKNQPKTYRMDLINYYKENESSLFNEVNGNLKLENGIIQMRDVKFSNSRATGVLNLNYVKQTGNMTSEAKFVFIPVGERRAVDFTIRSNGNIVNPSVQFNFATLEKFIDKTSTKEEKAQYLRQQVQKSAS